MKIKNRPVYMSGTKGRVQIRRIDGGIPHIQADEEIDLYYGLGYVHGHDRQLHMWLLNLIGKGEASEKLRGDDELIEIDTFMRWIDLNGDSFEELEKLTSRSREIFDAYSRGINDAVAATGTPFEFRMMGYRPDPWTPADTILMGKLISYVGLSQVQGDMEKFIIQLIQNGVDAARIKELFPSIREKIPGELVEIVKKTKLNPLVPEAVRWLIIPGLSASNNWAVRSTKTASGNAILCGDPHLAIQLPSIWYNVVMSSGNHFMMGATLPGVPALILGRADNIAWSVTYGCMDISDYYIEEVRGETYRRGKRWVPFTVREEIIRPKKKKPRIITYYENEHGVLECAPKEDGYYLCYAWSGRRGTAGETYNNLLMLPKAKNVKEAMRLFGGLTFAPFNWVIADTKGNIGYQMSGRYPKKAQGTSGLLPYYGWDSRYDWKGFISPTKHPRAFNPPSGYIVTANQDLNHLSAAKPVKLPMSSYRADRIAQLLKEKTPLTVDSMKEIHYDLYSLQAEAFMKIIRPLLPTTENGEILRKWDMRYDSASLGATLFEGIYRELLRIVFGEKGLGSEVMDYIIDETHLFPLLHGFYDRVLLNKNSKWFAGTSRESIYRTAIERALNMEPIPYGRTKEVIITNLFFAGKLPRILGFDYGPFERRGGRATIPQAQFFKIGRRPASFAPSYRLIADLGEELIHTNSAGGPSDRRFSEYYTTGIEEWLSGIYYTLKP